MYLSQACRNPCLIPTLSYDFPSFGLTPPLQFLPSLLVKISLPPWRLEFQSIRYSHFVIFLNGDRMCFSVFVKAFLLQKFSQ